MLFNRRRKSGSGILNLPYSGSRMPGEGEMAAFNTNLTSPTSGNRVMSTLGPAGGPMSVSRQNYGPVLEARRQARLAAADPGLSTRGRVNAPGRGARPVTGGLEGRGVRPAPGSRSMGRVKTGGPRPRLAPLQGLPAPAPIARAFGTPLPPPMAGAARLAPPMSTVGRSPLPPPRPLAPLRGLPAPAPIARAFGTPLPPPMAGTARLAPPMSTVGRSPLPPPMAGTARLGPPTGRPFTNMAPPGGKKGFLSSMSHMKGRTKLGIGLGLGIAAGVAMNRRGEGTSSGRQSAYRY